MENNIKKSGDADGCKWLRIMGMALCAGGVAQYWISAATDGRWLIDSNLWVNMECDFLMVFFGILFGHTTIGPLYPRGACTVVRVAGILMIGLTLFIFLLRCFFIK